MGGTNLYDPLNHVFTNPKKDLKLVRNIFVLTDGCIFDKKLTFDLISKYAHETRVHSFGFGSGVDNHLVKEMA